MEPKRYKIIARSTVVILRDRVVDDTEVFIRWQTSGEWLKYDAPWERLVDSELELQGMAEKFLDSCKKQLEIPRKRAMIALPDGTPIGWVNRYSHKGAEDAWLIGIDICEDKYLNRGFGSEALALWLDHLFSNSQYHRLGLETWSFNNRMIKVAERAGFVLEGLQRQVRKWQGEWINLYNYGMLRTEWERNKSKRTSL
jgi:RimJ/RimL family protein N-acetyltransferase